MPRKAISTLAATALAVATLGIVSPAAAQTNPPPATGGSVPATVTIADNTLCLSVDAVTLDFGLAWLNNAGEGFQVATPSNYLIQNCGNYTSQLWARTTAATGDGGAAWAPVGMDEYTTCSQLDTFVTAVTAFPGESTNQAPAWVPLGLADTFVFDLNPTQPALEMRNDLYPACVGSTGAGETMTFTIHYTITAPA